MVSYGGPCSACTPTRSAALAGSRLGSPLPGTPPLALPFSPLGAGGVLREGAGYLLPPLLCVAPFLVGSRGDTSPLLGDGLQSQLEGGAVPAVCTQLPFSPKRPVLPHHPSRSRSLLGEMKPRRTGAHAGSPQSSQASSCALRPQRSCPPSPPPPRAPRHSLAFLGSPSPMVTVRVLPPALRVATSPCPLTKVTLRVPPPPQPSFFTRNCSLGEREAVRPQ